jgi:molecular chaperone GrpE
MSKRDEERVVQAEADQPAQPAAGSEAASASDGGVGEDELTVLRREVEALQEKNLRQAAETQNLHKRAQREKEEALRYAESEFARDLLVVLDDLERALASVQETDEAQSVADGVRVVYDHFLKIFSQRGVRPIEAVGKPFDPSFHEALMQAPSTEYPAGTVVTELARGYMMHDRVIRASRVVVSSGPPAESEEA